MDFSKEGFAQFRDAMKEAVEQIEKDFEVNVNFGKITYDDLSFTIVTNVTKGASREDAEKNAFLSKAYIYGLGEEDYRKGIMMNGKLRYIVGVNTRKRKYPIIVEEAETGNRYCCTESSIHDAIKLADMNK